MVCLVVFKFDMGDSEKIIYCVMVKCFVIDVGFKVCDDVL